MQMGAQPLCMPCRSQLAWILRRRRSVPELLSCCNSSARVHTTGVNFIGHFHLVQLLLPTMQAQSSPARIVAVTCKSELDGSESPAAVLRAPCCQSELNGRESPAAVAGMQCMAAHVVAHAQVLVMHSVMSGMDCFGCRGCDRGADAIALHTCSTPDDRPELQQGQLRAAQGVQGLQGRAGSFRKGAGCADGRQPHLGVCRRPRRHW